MDKQALRTGFLSNSFCIQQFCHPPSFYFSPNKMVWCLWGKALILIRPDLRITYLLLSAYASPSSPSLRSVPHIGPLTPFPRHPQASTGGTHRRCLKDILRTCQETLTYSAHLPWTLLVWVLILLMCCSIKHHHHLYLFFFCSPSLHCSLKRENTPLVMPEDQVMWNEDIGQHEIFVWIHISCESSYFVRVQIVPGQSNPLNENLIAFGLDFGWNEASLFTISGFKAPFTLGPFHLETEFFALHFWNHPL